MSKPKRGGKRDSLTKAQRERLEFILSISPETFQLVVEHMQRTAEKRLPTGGKGAR